MELPAHPVQHPRIVTVALPTSPSPGPGLAYSPHTPAVTNRSLHSPGSPGNEHSPSALARHQLTRSLSPDLPTRDALYLFCNFSSYMRSPQEGADGIQDNTDFHDTIRLLDFARNVGGNPHANVHVLHLKYRFQTPDQGLPTTRQEKLSALNYEDEQSRKHTTVPQPFSTLHDPVIKVDYQDNGVFNPLPAQAIFQHISKACRPPPRIIVVSYVGSKATENHISAMAAWAHTSTPPIYVFSPLETRLRERRPLEDALHHAIPISMYASPVGADSPSPSSMTITHPISPYRTKSQDDTSLRQYQYQSPLRRKSIDSRPIPTTSPNRPFSPRTYPPDPVATLSILTDAQRSPTVPDADNPGDRVPLWMLAPGASVLHGSTSVSLGVKLSDFSAVNLTSSMEKGDKGSNPQNQTIDSRALGIRVSPGERRLTGSIPKVSLPPLDAHARRSNAATPEPISRTGSAASIRISQHNGAGVKHEANGLMGGHATTHLTPPDQDPRRLSPPDRKPAPSPPNSQQSWPRTKSWPTTRDKVPGWKRGRREVMEDALDEAKSDNGAQSGELSLHLEDLEIGDERKGVGEHDVLTRSLWIDQ